MRGIGDKITADGFQPFQFGYVIELDQRAVARCCCQRVRRHQVADEFFGRLQIRRVFARLRELIAERLIDGLEHLFGANDFNHIEIVDGGWFHIQNVKRFGIGVQDVFMLVNHNNSHIQIGENVLQLEPLIR
jgi:hypothetical protein